MKKINKRGYNQVDLFSVIGPSPYKTSIISILFGLDCIYKFDTSNDMWALTNKERHQNIDDAFVVKAEYKHMELANKNILNSLMIFIQQAQQLRP